MPVTYFDPQANRFHTAHSEPIRLQVSPAPNATPDVPAPAPAPAAAARPHPRPPLRRTRPWPPPDSVRRYRGWKWRWPPHWRPVRRSGACGAFAGHGAVGIHTEPRPVAIPAARPAPKPLTHSPTYAGVRQMLQEFARRHFLTTPGELAGARSRRPCATAACRPARPAPSPPCSTPARPPNSPRAWSQPRRPSWPPMPASSWSRLSRASPKWQPEARSSPP